MTIARRGDVADREADPPNGHNGRVLAASIGSQLLFVGVVIAAISLIAIPLVRARRRSRGHGGGGGER